MKFDQQKFNMMLDATVDRVMVGLENQPMKPIYKIAIEFLIASLFDQMLQASERLGYEKTFELFRASTDAFELAVKEMAKDFGVKL
jgi:hypothetical protein